MKLLPGSSSSLLLSVLLAQLPLFTSAFPAHVRRPDFDKLTNQTKHLQRMTQDLINAHKSDDLTHEQHRFKSLPAINNKANDLSSLELKATLSQLHADLRSFEQHFDWLNKVTQKHHHPLAFKMSDMISQIRILTNLIHRQMLHVDAPRLHVASPTLPHQPLSQWEMIQSSQVLLQRFRLFCDWAARAFLSLRSKM